MTVHDDGSSSRLATFFATDDDWEREGSITLGDWLVGAVVLIASLVTLELLRGVGTLDSSDAPTWVEWMASSTPITMLLVVMFFGALYLDGVGQQIGSYVPPLPAVLMPMRLVEGTAAWWEPIIAVILLLAFGVALVRLAERLYSRALLQTGGQLSLKAAWRLEE